MVVLGGGGGGCVGGGGYMCRLSRFKGRGYQKLKVDCDCRESYSLHLSCLVVPNHKVFC